MSRMVWVALALTVFAVAPLRAHEIGTTRVTATVERDRYRIEIVTDATSLAEKLAAVAGWSVPTPATAPALEGFLQRGESAFRRRVSVRFADVASIPALAIDVAPAADALSAPPATIVLTGAVPPGSQTLAWSYGWTFATYAFTLHAAGEASGTTWIEGGSAPTSFPLNADRRSVRATYGAWRYLRLGFTHIVPHGLDHMLFVLGIFLLTRKTSSVLWQVSAFTLAHSITLGLSLYGVISISPRFVEPLIALSIAYVAVENVFLADLKPWRVGLVFAFGLLHGLGFAGALRDVGLPRSEFATALVTFNLGVECGQLAVIGAAIALVGWCANRNWYRRRIVVPASISIAVVSVYWVMERMGVFRTF